MALPRSASICIPIRESRGEFVEVFPDELPEEAEEVVDVLRGELAALDLWLEVALAYRRAGRTAQFEHVLMEASSEEIGRLPAYRGAEVIRQRIILALSTHYLLRAAGELGSPEERARLMKEAAMTAGAANRLERAAAEAVPEVVWLSKGFSSIVSSLLDGDAAKLQTAEFELARASAAAPEGRSVMALVGQVCVCVSVV
jgi:hypothetical protein